MSYKHCIFDLYGTLVDIHTDEDQQALWEGLAKEFRSFGAEYTPDALHQRYLELVRQEETKLGALGGDAHESHPEIHLETVFEALFQQKGIVSDDTMVNRVGHLFRELSTEYIRLYDGVPELLRDLREKGIGVWLLSNAQRMFTQYEMDVLNLTDSFDGIYLSSDYGCKKPDSRFFRILLDERHISPEDAIMIGNDGTCDIKGAQDVGLSTLYIRSNISPKEPLPKADYVLKEMDITQVHQILLGK